MWMIVKMPNANLCAPAWGQDLIITADAVIEFVHDAILTCASTNKIINGDLVGYQDQNTVNTCTI